ncbi:MAG: hypothetical protein AAF823_04905 [Planctomycetota bacterium]
MTRYGCAAAQKGNSEALARRHFLMNRTPFELYDTLADPDCQINLIDDSEFEPVASRLRARLLDWMQQQGDPAAEALDRPNIETAQAIHHQLDERARRLAGMV